MDSGGTASSHHWILTQTLSRRFLYFLILLVISAFVISDLRSLPWWQALRLIDSSNKAWLAIAVLAYLAIFPCWAIQWQLLIAAACTVRVRVMAEIVAIISSIQHALPFFGAPVAATVLLSNGTGCGVATAASVYAIDQVVTGMAKLIAIGCAGLLLPLSGHFEAGANALLLGVVASCLVLVALSRAGPTLHHLSARAKPPWTRGLTAVAEFADGLAAIRSAKLAVGVFSLAVIKNALAVGGAVAVQCSVGMGVSVGSATAVVAALGLSTAIPIVPANIGVYEATVFFVYHYLGVSPTAALTVAILQHSVFLVATLAPGYLLLFWRYLRKSY